MSPRKKENKVLHLLKLIVSFPLILIGYIVNFIWKKSIHTFKQLLPRRQKAKAGFVLPTVVMIIVVVVLLTTAIFIRSFDRAKNASNYRVEQSIVNAATPALERAQAKLNQLLTNDKTLPRGTPSDVSIRDALKSARYTFGDETQLRLVYDIDKNSKTDLQGTKNLQGEDYPSGTIKKITDEELVDTAWKFPYDSDNNGKFDSFTLYSIVYRNPPLNTSSSTLTYTRKRTALEARALPSADTLQGCGTAGSENSLVAGSDWLKVGGKYKKAFYVYVANVPITTLNLDTSRSLNPDQNNRKYEQYNSNKSGFSGLEMSLEPSRIPLNNNAVWFDDDMEISGAADFFINGRIHTNGNLMVAGNGSFKLHFYLVSALDSCHYKEPENNRITVGGEMAAGDVGDTADIGDARIHLLKPLNTSCSSASTCGNAVSNTTGLRGTQVIVTTTGTAETIGKTTTEVGGSTVGYNSKAYANRLGLMVDGAINLWNSSSARIPPIVIAKAQARQANGEDQIDARRKELQSFFQERTRRVPYKEVPYQDTDTKSLYKPTTTTPYVSTPITDANFIFTGSAEIRPPVAWTLPFTTAGVSNTSLANRFYTNSSQNTIYLQATDPDIVNADTNKTDNFLGDRILIGNGLPKRWSDYAGSTNTSQTTQPVKTTANADVKWLNASGAAISSKNRYRQSRIEFLDDLGDLSRGGFWEQAAAKVLQGDDNPGGLRIITGAGIYAHNITSGTYNGSLIDLDTNASFLPRPSTYYGANTLEGGVAVPALPTGLQATTGQLYTLVWSDQMPLSVPDFPSTSSVDESTLAPDLRMRATTVYHYRNSQGQAQEPLACISSYYDPSTSATALNGKYKTSSPLVFPWSTATGTTNLPYNNGTGGRSNNGVVYPNPYGSSGRTAFLTATVVNELKEQARLMFPNGRIVNQPLQDAMIKLTVNVTDPTTPIVEGVDQLNMANYSSIDAAVCALRILTDATYQPVGTSPTTVDNGAIKEAAFLNGRQVKSMQQDDLDTNLTDTVRNYTNLRIEENRLQYNDRYNLPLEQRQPLEIRVTELDMGLLKAKAVTNVTGSAYNTTTYSAFATPGYQQNDEEYLIPNSGVIYVGRDDALMDLSAAPIGGSGTDNTYSPNTTQLLQSRSDLRLDPTRRPNGVRLINGADLSRKDFYRYAEKGLILATDLPLYVKGNEFNLHVDPTNTSTKRNEFTSALANDWTNFYKRNTASTAADALDPNFACVKGQTSTCTAGDRWRPATLLSDSISIVSDNFRDGFRNEGDFDLRNNIGNQADALTGSRRGYLKNGFWFNNYVTTADWIGPSDNYPSKDLDTVTNETQSDSSYLKNGVTPVQRRVDVFPEYLMEYCPKLPVSECTANDWIVAPGVKASSVIGQTFAIATHKAGTTAVAPTDSSVLRFPRRIAFQRTAKRLKLEVWGTGTKAVPIPIGIDSTGKIAAFSYNSTTLPRTQNNALWFIATNSGNVTGTTKYDGSQNLVYTNDKPLAFDLTSVTVGADTTDIPGVPSLNKPDPNLSNVPPIKPISQYTVCTKNGGASSDPVVVGGASGPTLSENCNTTGGAYDAINAVSTALLALAPDTGNNNNIVRPVCSSVTSGNCPTAPSLVTKLPITAGTSVTFTSRTSSNLPSGYTYNAAQPITNVIDITGDQATASNCTTIQLNGDDSSLFVFRVPSTTTGTITVGVNGNPGSKVHCGLQVELLGDVDPNNVFWAFNNGVVQFKEVGTQSPKLGSQYYHKLVGTIVTNGSANPDLNTFVLDGGRLLNPTVKNGIGPNTTIFAIATDGQPRSYPMLQIHSPTGTPSSTLSTAFSGTFSASSPWVFSNTPILVTYNAIFATGATPSAPGVFTAGASSTRRVCTFTGTATADCGETNGGLHNFMRLLEYWNSSTDAISIQGSFIEARLSNYDTGPFKPTDLTELDVAGNDSVSLFGYTVSSNKPTYLANNSSASYTGFRYPGGAGGGIASYYQPASRLWGYDVGLLYASPDLFSQRFTSPPTGDPNQSFRQVGRDDPWVQSLLCATQAPSGTTKTGYDDARSSVDVLAAYGSNHTFALSASQRPTRCPVCWGTNCP
jgi:hypothetical protein